MEPRFEVTLIPDRKICHEFGAITARKNAATWVLLGCSLVVLLVLYPLCMVFDGGSACQSLWAVGLMSFYIWLLLGWGNGRNVYRTLCTQLQGMPVTYAFGPNEVYVTSKPENSCVRYDSFVQILETPRLFALYISQNTAHLIPKQALQTGTPEEFRAYREEVTGKPVRQVRGKRSTGATWLLGIGMAILAIAISVGATSAQEERQNRLTTFTQDPYSISLPAGFRKTTQEDAALAAEAEDAYVCVRQQEAEPLCEAWGVSELSAKDLALKLQELAPGIQEVELHELDNGAVCLTYLNESDDIMFFYCEAIVKSEDTFWVTELICKAEDQFIYRSQFLDWAETITISPVT